MPTGFDPVVVAPGGVIFLAPAIPGSVEPDSLKAAASGNVVPFAFAGFGDAFPLGAFFTNTDPW